ncbi:MAG: membrane protein insertase YidC [Deltaproteobacteria bacterium]|jgi:YidC/Oxa1 family membrane protein insertase|nr:membrane protein insertase YidC [Deltaproteobacteria bacterium]
MSKRVIVTVLAAAGFFMLWDRLLMPGPQALAQAPAASTGGAALTPATTEDAAAKGRTPDKAAPEAIGSGLSQEAPGPPGDLEPLRSVTVETPEYVAVFTEDGGRLSSFRLRKYRSWEAAGKDSGPMQELVKVPERDGPESLPMSLVYSPLGGEDEELDRARFTADSTFIAVGEGGTARLVFTSEELNSGLSITRAYEFAAGSYAVCQEVRIENAGGKAIAGIFGTTLRAWPFGGRRARHNVMAAVIDGKLVTGTPNHAADVLSGMNPVASADFLGYMDQYFLTALVLGDPAGNAPADDESSPWRLAARRLPGRGLAVTAAQPLELAPGAETSMRFDFFYGPKDTGLLRREGHSLFRSVDFGALSFLVRPLLFLLRSVHGIVGNYGIAIVVATLLIRMGIWPLAARSFKSMRTIRDLAEPARQICKMPGADSATRKRELTELYSAYGVEPMSGCLPLVLQIPFFVVFYKVLDRALEFRGSPFTLWIRDLSAPDRLFDFGIWVPILDPPTGIPALTLLTGAAMVWQQRMTPFAGDPKSSFAVLLPLILVIFLLNSPSGLVLYCLVSTVLSILQQKLADRAGGSPVPAGNLPS